MADGSGGVGSEGRALGLTYCAYYAYLGIVTPFFPLWLHGRGLEAAGIAQAGALVMVATTIGQLLLPAFTVRLGLRRLAILTALAALLATTALLAVRAGGELFVVVGLSGLFCGALLPIADALALDGREGGWGGMRAWGSLGFAFASLACGWAIDRAGAGSVVPGEAAMLALVLAGTLAARPSAPAGPVARVTARDLGATLARGDLWLLVLAVATVNASHAYYYTFGNLHWAAVYRFGSATSGLLWAVGVVAEIAVLAWCGRAFRHGAGERRAVLLLLAGAGGGVLRWSLTAADPPLPVLLALQLLHGLTFGATMLGGMEALRAMVPARLLSPALGLFAAMVHGVVIGAVTLLLAGRFGPQGSDGFALMALVAGAGGGIALAFAFAARRQRPSGCDRLST